MRLIRTEARRLAGAVAMVSSLLLVVAACSSSSGTAATASSTPAGADIKAQIAQAAIGSHRSEKNRARNSYRNPVETLAFFGLRNDMTVIEISPGGLWYSEILAPVLKDNGRFIAAGYDVAVEGQPSYRYKQTEAMLKRFADDPANYANVEVAKFSPPQSLYLGADGEADMVVTFRNSHGWMRDGVAEKVYQAAFDALKPGGVFGVVQHRGDNRYVTAKEAKGRISGYLPESLVVATAESIGFVLEATSEVNANPKDTADHPAGVWSLPPVLRFKEVDRDKYLAIGESDRMTLRFRKP